MKISKQQAIRVAEYLQNGGFLCNAKVFSIEYSYRNGKFVRVFEDKREHESEETELSLNEFIADIQRYDEDEFLLKDKIK